MPKTISVTIKWILSWWPKLPQSVISSVQEFQSVRNKIIHGHSTDPNDVLRAIDSGITILKAIKNIPRVSYIVYHPGVDLYADKECTKLREDVRGVILESISPAGLQREFQIFPTTRTYFKKGMQVTWEWNMELHWDETWFHDPDTQEIKYAWTGAFEFIGRPLDEV